jgi:glucose-6-phosphate dehydrogenase assembly protein OpcA
MMATAINPESILRELQDLWSQQAQAEPSSGSVLRACSMTLVVVARDPADAEQVHETITMLMHSHPSRSIVLAPGGDGEMSARVFAECWKPLGSAQQICAEGIEISTGQAPGEEVARLLVALRAPDLPLVVWWRGAEKMEPGPLDAINRLASKVIFDSIDAEDAQGVIDYLRTLRHAGLRVADLNWARLTGWREVLAHLIDDGALMPQDVRSVKVGCGGGTLSTSALYFAAWMRSCLPGVRVTIVMEDHSAGIQSVTLAGAKTSLRLERVDGSCLHVTGAGRNYRATLPPTDEQSLMRQELSILGPDPVWERVLAA